MQVMEIERENIDPGDFGERRLGSITGIVVHRIEVSQEDASYGDTPPEVVRFFREHPVGVKAAGGRMPYPFLIDETNTVARREQELQAAVTVQIAPRHIVYASTPHSCPV